MASKRIEAIKLSDYFAYQRNKIVTYRIIPHVSVTNNTNAKLWRTLNRMYEMYDKLPSRLKRKGFRFELREKDTIWFDIVFRKDNVEFYASTTEIWARKFRDVLEQRMRVKVVPADVERLQIPDGANLYEVKLARHNVLSLGVDLTEQTSPIGAVMSVLDEMDDDRDFVRLSICAETYDRVKWAKQAEWALDKLSKGKVPARAKFSVRRASKASKRAFITLINEIYDVINDALTAIGNVFFKSDKAIKKSVALDKPNELVEELHSGKLSSRTLAKANQPVWRSYMRIATYSPSSLRADLMANSVAGAYAEIAGDNELNAIKIRFKARKEEVRRELNEFKLSARTRNDPDVSLLSCEEMAKVSLQLPTAVVQQRFETALQVNRKIETEVPAVFKSDGLLVGHNDKQPIYLPTRNPNEFYRGYVFAGEMGTGKDTAIQNFVVEGNLRHNISFIVIDQVNKEGAQGMANGIRDSLPPDRIIDLDFSDEDYLPPLDLTEVISKLGRRGADRFANELIDFFDVADMAQTKAILRAAAQASGGSLFETKRIIESDEYRLALADKLAESSPLVAYELRKFGETLARNKADPILSRLDDFFGDSTLSAIFSQPPHAELDFERFMREGKVVLIRVPDRILSTVAVRTLVHWITLKALMTRLLMASDDQANGTFIVYNEPQTYLNDGLSRLIARIATQGRKERLGALIAVQYFDQLGSLKHDLLGGGINWFLFRNGERKIYEELKHRLEPQVSVEEAMAIQQYHALCLLNFGGRPQPPFLARMLPPSYERYQAYDNSFLTRRHARQYGRSWQAIERMIVEQVRC